jgi:rare lipoprotein A
MGRWLVILSLAVAQWPDVATASPKSSDVPLWKRLLSSFTPSPRPATPAPRPARRDPPHGDPAHRDKAQLVRSAATPKSPEPATDPEVGKPPSSPEPVAGSQVREPPKSNQTDCNGGKRINSAFYWQGQRTASGQPFDPRGMTAAHRTLPFGTQLTVMNPRTGKSVTVIINDRGPFISGISLDLSLAAAQAIGMHGTGTVCIW